MVHFFDVEMCIFLDYSVSHSNVGLHWAIGIFLLDEVNTDCSRPFIGANFIQSVEIDLLWVHFKAEKDQTWAELRMHFFDLKVHLIKSIHICLFIMYFNKFTILVILCQLTKQSSELDSVISISDVFEKNMFDVFFEYVKSED